MFPIGIFIGISVGNSQPIPKVKFDLLENGLDFITEAIIEINKSSNHKRLKYSIIHLCSGIELIFKEVLRNQDWRLLFQELKDANPVILKVLNSINWFQDWKPNAKSSFQMMTKNSLKNSVSNEIKLSTLK